MQRRRHLQPKQKRVKTLEQLEWPTFPARLRPINLLSQEILLSAREMKVRSRVRQVKTMTIREARGDY